MLSSVDYVLKEIASHSKESKINNFIITINIWFVGVDRNDIPLLMSIASAHTPNLRSSLTLIPQ